MNKSDAFTPNLQIIYTSISLALRFLYSLERKFSIRLFLLNPPAASQESVMELPQLICPCRRMVTRSSVAPPRRTSLSALFVTTIFMRTSTNARALLRIVNFFQCTYIIHNSHVKIQKLIVNF
jgi:hypothetical protein